MTKKRKIHPMRWLIAGVILALLAVAGVAVSLLTPEPDMPAEVTATAEPTAQTATVTVDGEGVASDVTITVIDPNTGLTPDDGAEGLGDASADPGVAETQVGDETGKVIAETNVTLPTTKEVLVEPGQQITVAAQNGTTGAPITATVTVGDQTVTDTKAGDNAAVTVTGANE